MSGESESPRPRRGLDVQVVIAIIGAAATVVAALIGVLPNLLSGPEPVPAAPMPEPSAITTTVPTSAPAPTMEPSPTPIPSPVSPPLSDASKLELLTTGLARARVEEIFGIPQTARSVCSGDIRDSCAPELRERYQIHTYLFDAYDLRIVYDEESVRFFAVTTNSKDFNPTFAPLQIAQNEEDNKLGLGSFNEIVPSEPTDFGIFLGMGARSWYWETHYLGGAGQYLTFYLGWSSVGAGTAFIPEYAEALVQAADEERSEALLNFRVWSVPNTYGFYEEDADFAELMSTMDGLFLDSMLYEGRDDLY